MVSDTLNISSIPGKRVGKIWFSKYSVGVSAAVQVYYNDYLTTILDLPGPV